MVIALLSYCCGQEAGSGTIAESLPSQHACVPPCRSGHMRLDGNCVQMCNPPCPDGRACGDDGECHVLKSISIIEAIRGEFLGITRVEKVQSPEKVIQLPYIGKRFDPTSARLFTL